MTKTYKNTDVNIDKKSKKFTQIIFAVGQQSPTEPGNWKESEEAEIELFCSDFSHLFTVLGVRYYGIL